VVNRNISSAYNLISYTTIFIVLAIASIIVPKTELLSLNTYYTVILFSTVCSTGLYFVCQLFKQDSTNLFFSIYDVIFMMFIGLLFLSSIWARNPVYAYNVGIQWTIFYCVYKLFQHFSFEEKRQHFLVLILTVGFLISLCIVSFLFFYTADYSGKLSSIFTSEQFKLIKNNYVLYRNAISSFLVLGTGIPIYWLIKSKTKKQILLILILLSFFTFVLMLSRSRGSLLAFFTILILFYLSNFFIKILSWKKVILSILFVITGIFTALILQADESTYLSFLNPLYGVNSPQGDGRLQMWDISFQLIGEQPCHNYFVDIFFSLGVFGLIAFSFLIFFYPLKLIIKKLNHQQIRDLDYLVFSGILAFSIVALFYGTLYNNLNRLQAHPVLLFTFIALLNNGEKPLSKKISKGIPIIFVFLIVFFNLKAYNNNQNLAHYRAALKNKDYVTGEKILSLLDKQKVGFINKRESLPGLRANLHLKQKKYGLAEIALSKQLEEHPYNFKIWHKLGDTQFNQKKYAPAKYSYQQALLYNCDYIPASIKLIKTEKKLKNFQNVKALKNELKYIDSYIQQYKLNEATWGKHEKLVNMNKTYQKFKKKINAI